VNVDVPIQTPNARAKYVVVTGAIAAGASTLAEALVERFQWGELLEGEVAVDNPFFKRAYSDSQRWFLASQLHFLSASVERHQHLAAMLQAAGRGQVVVEDRTPFEHMAAYTAAYVGLGRVPADEATLLRRVANVVEARYIEPDLLVYRQMTDGQLASRVRERGRDGEEVADLELLESIRDSFDTMVSRWERSPTLVVPANVDVKDSAQFEALAAEIHRALPAS
jgi:deoxyadenosine/deoxycytidine kinase